MENITDSLKNIKSGMVVTAHPDDAEYGCSGTVAKLANNGSDMVYVLCTDGSKGTEDKNLSPEKLAKIRNTEQLNAGKVLGLKDVVFLGYPSPTRLLLVNMRNLRIQAYADESLCSRR